MREGVNTADGCSAYDASFGNRRGSGKVSAFDVRHQAPDADLECPPIQFLTLLYAMQGHNRRAEGIYFQTGEHSWASELLLALLPV